MQIYQLKNTLTKNKYITLHLLKIFLYKGITILSPKGVYEHP